MEPHIGAAEIYEVTLTLDTLIYASGDVLSDTAEVAKAAAVNGGRVRLVSAVVIDEDDQGIALDLVFFSTNVSLGTKNAAVSIADADVRNVLGHLVIAAGDYVDLINSRVATRSGLDLVLEAVAGSRSVYVSAVTRGTPTHTAAGLRLRLGLVAA